MSAKAMISRVLQLACLVLPETDVPTLSPPSPPAGGSPRERLREAHRAVPLARQTVEQRESDTNRVKGLIVAADQAEREFKVAEAQAVEASREWASTGAVGELPQAAHTLIDAAEQARKKANAAHIVATGAKEALTAGTAYSPGHQKMLPTKALPSVTDAKDDLATAEQNLGQAAGAVLYAEGAAADILRATELWAELSPMLPKLAGLNFLRRFSGGTYPWAPELSKDPTVGDLLSDIRSALNYNESQLHELTRPWKRLGARLVRDSEAVVSFDDVE